jgi:hypothetical protein
MGWSGGRAHDLALGEKQSREAEQANPADETSAYVHANQTIRMTE